MAIKYGFYNSQGGDKKYSAEDFSSMFDGLITDGIFATYGDAFAVTSYSGMTVKVGTGRAWFNHTWTLNNSSLSLSFTKPSVNTKRIDTIVIEVNTTGRSNTIKKLTGSVVSSSSTAPLPTLTNGNGVYQYPLADIELDGNMSAITQDRIKNRRGSAANGTPFVTGVVQSVSVDELVAQWEMQFVNWFDDIQGSLATDPATHLTSLVDNATNHRNIFRGKNLGSTITAAQKAAIKNGTFTDIYVGDYWQFADSSTKWRVVDINYWYKGVGINTEITNHVLVMSDTPVIGSVMANTSGTTVGGFANSSMATSQCVMFPDRQEDLEQFVDYYLPAQIYANYVSIREYLVNAVDESSGRPIGGGWYNTFYSVPSEIMVYGTRIWSYGNSGVVGLSSGVYRGVDHLFTNSCTQLALFRLAPQYMSCSKRYWLRDAISTTEFAVVLENSGTANRALAGSSYSIRPIFAICGTR